MDTIFDQIRKERSYQKSRFGVTFDDSNTANDWSSYINRYNGNASFALDGIEWRKQMVKVAALAVAAIEAFDRNGELHPRHYDN